MRHLRFAAALAGAVAFAPAVFAEDMPVDETSATPAIQVENAAKLWAEFTALESAWDPALGKLYMEGAVIDRTELTDGEPKLTSFTSEQYLAAMPDMFAQMKAGNATEAWTNTKVMYDGPGRTRVTADLVITAGGVASSTSKVNVVIFDMVDGPMQVTADQRVVAAPGVTPPVDEAAATVEQFDAALGALDSAALAALIPADAKVIQLELGVDGDELSRTEQTQAEFLASVEEEFAPLRAAKGNGRFIVYESYRNEDGTWYVRGETVMSSPDTHDTYNTWGDSMTRVQKDGAWTIGTFQRSFQHPAT